MQHTNKITDKKTETTYSILLATYNGERFIKEFLCSCPWDKGAKLIVRDDGSTDNTVNIIREFVSNNDVNLTLLEGERLGAMGNFAKLLEQVDTDYFFFADQDDVWEENKIPFMLEAMKQYELKAGENTPLLLYCDAFLIDASGNKFQDSLYSRTTIPNKWNEEFKNVLVMPHVPGCTMLGNKALAKAAVPIAKESVMHDAWVLQIAGALGKIHELDISLVRYRQHDANVFGAKVMTFGTIFKKICDGIKPKYESIVKSQIQAKALLEHCGDLMSNDKKELCKAWANATNEPWLKRRIIYAKYGFRKAGLIHNVVLWVCG